MRVVAETTKLATTGFSCLGDGGNDPQQASHALSDTAENSPDLIPVKELTSVHSADDPALSTRLQGQVATVGNTNFADCGIIRAEFVAVVLFPLTATYEFT
jgi:hypothetical protein